MAKTDTVEIIGGEHYLIYLRGISEIRKDKRFFDIKLCIGDKEIDSHKAVLAAFSPYFSDYFDDDFLKSGEDRIDLTDNTNMTVLTSILDYMYSGSISFLIEDGAVLMKTLDFFQMQYVKDLCETYLVDNIDAENYVAVFNLAEEVPLERLKEMAVDYINKNFRKIHGSDEFKKFTKDQLESVIQKTCDVDAEIMYRAIIGWIKHDTQNRKDYVEQLLKYVPIKNLTASFYWEWIQTDDFLKNDVGGRQWVMSSFLDHPESPLRLNRYKPTLHIFAIGDNTYYEMNVHNKAYKAYNLTTPKLNYCAMAKYKNSIYAFDKGDENEIGSIELKYDTTTKWTRVVASSNFIKSKSSNCKNGDAIYLIGGFENSQQVNTCVRYNVETSQWTTLPDMQYARCNPGVVSCNSSIYVFGGYFYGGYSTDGSTFVERYDHREGIWFNNCEVYITSYVSSALLSEYNVCCLQRDSGKVIHFDTRSGDYIGLTSQYGNSLASIDGRLYTAYDEGICEYHPYELKWSNILREQFFHPILLD